MPMDYEKFIVCLRNGNLDEARRYKNGYVPKDIYQFISLQNDDGHKDKNQQKLDALKNGNLWLSKPEGFNDPFEFKALCPDQDKLGEDNKEHALRVLSEIKKYILCSCFVGNFIDNNMPMWAHYANKHQGFCVQYAVKDPNLFFPIFYMKQRLKTAAVPVILYQGLLNAAAEGRPDVDPRTLECVQLVLLSTMIKSDFWKYEEEWRVIWPTEDVSGIGKLIPLNKLGIVPKTIYIGMFCGPENQRQLIETASEINCEAELMYVDDYLPEFRLRSKPV